MIPPWMETKPGAIAPFWISMVMTDGRVTETARTRSGGKFTLAATVFATVPLLLARTRTVKFVPAGTVSDEP